MNPLLEIKNLGIGFKQDGKIFSAVKNISFSLTKGRLTAIVGESGSGKSLTALSILQLLPKEAIMNGEVIFNDGNQSLQLNNLTQKEINKIRGNRIAMIFQEPMTSLNPVFSCGYQVMESLMTHKKISRKEAKKQAIALFEKVQIPDPPNSINKYPHQLSGGQKQRVMIAMAMSCGPAILIADEPTTALDVRVQKNILQLIKTLQQSNNMAVMLITHDLGLVAEVADEIMVMYQGNIVEQGDAAAILKNPTHPYTRALLACRPSAGLRGHQLPILRDLHANTGTGKNLNSETYASQTNHAGEIVLSVKSLEVNFPASKDIFGKPKSFFRAVDHVSFDVRQGEILGLVGESGCGKTTLGRAILQLVKPTAGKIILNGADITAMPERVLRRYRKDFQVVFQDPYGSLNPRITIGNAIMEALLVHYPKDSLKARKEKVISMLEKVQLQPDYFARYPHQFSGGQRQRICIARALILEPRFLVFDESLSALDVSIQAGILNLITELKAEFNFSSVFISHDLSVVHHISDRILVMNKGKIIEEGNAADVFLHPQTDYTRQLIDAIPGRNII